jgi:hypothetical protein
MSGEACGRHVAVPWTWREVGGGALHLNGQAKRLTQLEAIDLGNWPAAAPG